jgi:L-serine dehydratase
MLALICTSMALVGYDALISLDEVIDAARALAERMPREHRCTSLEIEKSLASLWPGCGSCS